MKMESFCDLVKNEQSIEKLRLIFDGKYFIYSEKDSTRTKKVAICALCLPKEVKICSFNNYTSNFVNHLKKRHGEDKFKECQSYLKNGRRIKPKNHSEERDCNNNENKSFSPTQEKLNENILNFFINSMLPLQVIEDPFFKKIFQSFDMSSMELNIVNRKTLVQLIKDRFENNVTITKNELCGAEQICTIAEIWTSKTQRFLGGSSKTPRFLGVTAHWLDLNLQRKSKTLACLTFPYTYKYDQIAELLQKVHSEFGLDYQRVLTAMNDRSHFVNAIKEFGIDMESDFVNSEATEESNNIVYIISEVNPHIANKIAPTIELPDHFKCPVYKLNLCAIKVLKYETEIAKIHSTVIRKCNTFWNIAVRPKSAEVIRNIIGHGITKPEITEWGSLYNALEEIASIQEKSEQLCTSLGITEVFTVEDFQYINEFLRCLKPIAQALQVLKGDQDMYYGILLPCLLSLRKKLRKLNEENFVFCNDLLDSYLVSVEGRFGEYFCISSKAAQKAVVAAMSYPRFKDNWISLVRKELHPRIRSIFETVVVRVIAEDYKRLKVKTKETDDSYFEFDSSKTESNKSIEQLCNESKAEDIITRYLADTDRSLFMLVRHPEIRRVFKKYNNCLPSTGPERIFSNTAMANITELYKLSDEMIEKRLLLKSNLS